MNKYLILLLVLIQLLSSCNNNPIEEVSSPQLSKDDNTIYFQYFDGLKGSIYKMVLTDSLFEQISPITNEFTFYHPKLTKDEKKVIFVGRKIGTNLSTIYISKIDGSSIKSLFTDKYVYDAFLYNNQNEIIYSKPDTFANYSPIVSKSAHGYDIFSFNLERKKINKLTNFHSYSIDGISDYKGDSLLYNDEDYDGICAIERNNPSMPRIIIKNDNSDNMHHLYGYPVYVERYNIIIFEDAYALCIMTSKKQIIRIYLSKSMIDSFCVFNTLPRVLFTVKGESCFYSINFDGTDLRKIGVNLSKQILNK